jgi:2-methylisocitrate lyase-like PEP mutase family enzyme
MQEAAAKIRVAAEARSSSDFLILARTDARTSYGLDEALRRAEAYAHAGADVLFVESPESEAEMERICAALAPMPLMVNVVEGGKTPVLSRARYIELGYQLAIYPATAFLACGRGVEAVYSHIKETGSSVGVEHELTDFMGFSKAMGFEKVWEFDREHADYSQGDEK